ncbi:MAG: DUF2330 domain-containing protein [Polyangiaceae bacterium]
MRAHGWPALGLAVTALALASAELFPAPARACGGVFSRALRPEERRPSLSLEQTLIVHDAEAGREHFIREVAFRASRQPFGFVVPTPSQPEVRKVSQEPFSKLRSMYPFRSPLGGGEGTGQGFGKGLGGAPRGGVRVLEVSKVGSFTAFVLAAEDAKGLAAWLAKHGLTSSPRHEEWLALYVKAKFFFVAMRYDPVANEDAEVGRTKSETVRLSFDTPLPFYPYREPDAGSEELEPRMIDLWLLSTRAHVPVSTRTSGGAPKWVRPFAEGFRYEAPRRADLESALGADAKLLPTAAIQLQRFVDQKRSRHAFGDVVFVPATRQTWNDKARAELGPLMRVLDPKLLEGAR